MGRDLWTNSQTHLTVPAHSGSEFLKSRNQHVDQATMSAGKPSRGGDPSQGRSKRPHRRRRQRKRRLTDKIRAALARAAAQGRRDVTEQLGSLYRARVEEELDRGEHRRSRDGEIPPRRALRGTR